MVIYIRLTTLPEQLFDPEWNIKPRRGRQKKVWSRMVDDMFKTLHIDKSEWLQDTECGGFISFFFGF